MLSRRCGRIDLTDSGFPQFGLIELPAIERRLVNIFEHKEVHTMKFMVACLWWLLVCSMNCLNRVDFSCSSLSVERIPDIGNSIIPNKVGL